MKYLVDIDWVIDALANIPAAITPLRQLAHDGIAVSMISFGELYDGAYGSRVPLTEIARIQQFLSSYPVINLSDAIMDRFAQTRTLLRSQGMLIPNMDILTALAHNLTLLTRNVRHFQRIPGLARYQP